MEQLVIHFLKFKKRPNKSNNNSKYYNKKLDVHILISKYTKFKSKFMKEIRDKKRFN